MNTLAPRPARSLLFTVLGLALCIAQAAASPVTVTDFYGREVHLPGPATRIVALAPHIVENLYSAGAGGQVVGAVSYSDYPAAAKNIKRVGDFHSWSLEAIIALNPDLIVMWGSGNGNASLPTLERLGIPVFISEPRKLADIPYSLRAFGQLAGTAQVAEAEARRVEQALALLAQQHRRQQPVSVFYQIWNEPLQTINGEHMISQVIEVCGGFNVFADTPTLAPKISLEAVLARNPQAIVASGMDTARPEWLDDWQRFTGLQAVRDQHLFFVPPDHLQRPTARILDGARVLCNQLETLRLAPTSP